MKQTNNVMCAVEHIANDVGSLTIHNNLNTLPCGLVVCLLAN